MEQKNNGRGIFYGVIGVATLVVAIIGATFAYFTATAQDNNTITGNMATVKLNLAVEKVTDVDVTKGGLIPMSNGMVESAVSKNEVCVDDNGNAVCQIYKVTITNNSSAGQFVDGYVALKGGSGTSTDYTYAKNTATTMRWAQVFKKDESEGGKYSTGGVQKLGSDTENVTLAVIGNSSTDDPTELGKQDAMSKKDIRTTFDDNTSTGVATTTTIAGSSYQVIGKNYIRVSDHAWGTEGNEKFDRTTDVTSALIYNNSISANGTSVYYFVVWLSENGKNQTAEAAESSSAPDTKNPGAEKFFSGTVAFVSAQGSEVSATFSGYTRVTSVATANG